MKNPILLLDEALADWVSPRVRRLIHSVLLLTAVVLAAVLAADGDWKQALIALAVAAYTGSNRANTGIPEVITAPEGVGNPEGSQDTI